MAYGDQPALTTELVEWARTSGFNVVAAGKEQNIYLNIIIVRPIPFGITMG